MYYLSTAYSVPNTALSPLSTFHNKVNMLLFLFNRWGNWGEKEEVVVCDTASKWQSSIWTQENTASLHVFYIV